MFPRVQEASTDAIIDLGFIPFRLSLNLYPIFSSRSDNQRNNIHLEDSNPRIPWNSPSLSRQMGGFEETTANGKNYGQLKKLRPMEKTTANGELYEESHKIHKV